MLLRVLGPVEIEAGGEVRSLSRRRERCLLGILALELNRVVPADRLAELLWDGDPPGRARRILQGHVSRIRVLLAQARAAATTPACELVTVGRGYRLAADPERVDVHRFGALVDSAAAIDDPATRVDQLRTALDLWRGPALEQAATEWLRQRLCTELEERRLAAIEDLMSHSLILGRERAVLPELARIATTHPLRERLVELHMQALHRVGRKADALEVYHRTRIHLADELGIDPSPALRARHRAILRDDPPPHAADPTAGSVPRQLPVAVGHFVGRDKELTALTQAHDMSTVVISAIDGMAGIGKTALAVHAAQQVADRYPDGQLFLDLRGYNEGMAPIEPAEALDDLLRALGVSGTQIPTGLDQRAALYRSQLARRRMLIVLDNAATETQVQPLLAGSAGCLVLITSRSRLAGLDHTHTLSLETLSVPDAVALLRQTVGEHRLAGQPESQLVELVELCGLLPLAIRIAAARLRSHPNWTPSHLVERLRDQQHRLGELEAGQRSVTAALDLSYQQLSPGQQRAYRLLGIHPGPDFDAYATAALLDSTLQHASRVLDQLLEAHLLQEPTPGRYRFHDLTRAHAAHTTTGELAVPIPDTGAERLLDYYRHTALAAMDAAYPYEREHRPQVAPTHIPRPELTDPAAALDWLDAELPNLLAAAWYATEHNRPTHLQHMSTILHGHLRLRGRYHDAETLHRQALAAADAAGDQGSQLEVLNGLGDILRLQGRYEQATDQYQRALQTARATGNRSGEVNALIGPGYVHLRQGRYGPAADHLEQALQIARATGNRSGVLTALTGLGYTLLRRGRYGSAADRLEQALQIACATGNHVGELEALIGLGHAQRVQGRYAEAAVYLERALRIAGATGNRPVEVRALSNLGHIHRALRRYEQATDYLERALRIARATGNRRGEMTALSNLGYAHLQQGWYAQAADCFQRLFDLAQASGHPEFEFEAWQCLGRLSYATGDLTAAVVHHERALTLADERSQPDDRARAHDGLAHAHHALHQYEQARTHWRHALNLLTGLGVDHTDHEETTTATIRAHLASLDQQSDHPATGAL